MVTVKRTSLLLLLISGMASAGAQDDLEALQITGGLVNGLQDYQLSSESFSTASTTSQGQGTLTSAKWIRPQLALQLRHEFLKHQVAAPSGYRPSTIDSTLEKISITGEIPLDQSTSPIDFAKYFGYRVLIGIEYRKRGSDSTSPNLILPSNLSIGPRVGGGYYFDISKIWSVDLKASLFTPLYFDERSAKTGSRDFSFDSEATLAFIYHVNHFIDFSIGMYVDYERLHYSGRGERGSSNAVESYTHVLFPVELRFQL